MTGLIEQMNHAVAQSLADCVRTGSWRTYAGPLQADLVGQLQQLLQCEHVGLASSGTAALERVLTACGLASGDEVLLSGYDYPGNFSAIERCGARPVLVDLQPDGWQISLEGLEQAYAPACRALVVSHLHGQLQPMRELQAWCRDHNVRLIQDACQALGAQSQGQTLTELADATILSFGGSKVLSAGRGGAWASRDAALAQHVRIADGAGSGRCELSELQAAAILAQLPFLPQIMSTCRTFFSQQAERWERLWPGIATPWQRQVAETAFYQAGWLLPQPAVCSAAASSPTSTPATWLEGVTAEYTQALQQIGIGGGFPGYHRRSSRRCRVPHSLHNTASVVGRTVTVHYSTALRRSPQPTPNYPRDNSNSTDAPTNLDTSAGDQILVRALASRKIVGN